MVSAPGSEGDHVGRISLFQRAREKNVVFQMNVLVKRLFQRGEAVPEGPPGVAGILGNPVIAGQFSELPQRRPRRLVLLLHDGDRSLRHYPFSFFDHGKENLFFPGHVILQVGFEATEDREEPVDVVHLAVRRVSWPFGAWAGHTAHELVFQVPRQHSVVVLEVVFSVSLRGARRYILYQEFGAAGRYAPWTGRFRRGQRRREIGYVLSVMRYDILCSMRSEPETHLLSAFRTYPVLTFDQIREALGGVSEATARRHLRAVPYRSSYSHNGRYYTLFEEGKFDRWGLWSHEGIRVSRDGTLTATVERLIGESESGWTRRELQELLGVSVQTVLTTLRRRGKVDRARVGPAYVYVSAGSAQQQLEHRRRMSSARQRRSETPLEVVVSVLLVLIRHPKSTMDEVVRRLKGHSPPIHIEEVEEVFERYDLAQKRGRSS